MGAQNAREGLGAATPLAAAAGLVRTMVGAALTHLRRGERSAILVIVVLGGLAAFVAAMRLRPNAF